MFRSGDPLSLSTLLGSRRKLSQLGLFSHIAMDPQLEDIAGEEDVVVGLTEHKLNAFKVGLGYGSEDMHTRMLNAWRGDGRCILPDGDS